MSNPNQKTATIANIGRWSSICAGALTSAFGLSLVFDFESETGIDFFVCFLLPLAYLMITTANSHLIKASTRKNPNDDITNLFFADLAVSTAIIYACYIFAVYYLQLTYVRNAGNVDPIVLSIVQYNPGTAIFAVDILGYVLLSVSTIFVALSIKREQQNYVLVNMLYFHGLFGLTSIFVPCLPMLYEESKDPQSDNFIWQLPLISWCVIFAPICLLMGEHFRTYDKDGTNK